MPRPLERTRQDGECVGVEACPEARIRITLASDVRLFREALTTLLSQESACEVAATFATVAEATRFVGETNCQVLLLDMRMPGSRDLCAMVRFVDPSPRIVGFAVEETPNDVIACAELGLSAYVPREGTYEQLVSAVRGAINGRLECPPHIAGSLFQRLRQLSEPLNLSGGASRLTRREREIVALVARNLSNKEIAWELHLSAATVKNHLHNIMEKLHVHRRTDVAIHLRSV